jgi:hypothetical protein
LFDETYLDSGDVIVFEPRRVRASAAGTHTLTSPDEYNRADG